jgi:hypothetical protein
MSAIYLTPKRFRTLGTGVDLTGMSDADILPSLTIAAAMVNSCCAAPTDHDFRGGSVSLEQHTWDIGNQWKLGSNRVYPYHRPIKEVSQLRIDITTTQYLLIDDPTKLYVNNVEGWVEPIALALTSYGLFGGSILPSVGLREPVARINYTYGWQFDVIGEELTSYSEGVLQAINQFWFDDPVPVIYKNSVTLPTDQYEIDYTEGIVTVSSYDSTAIYAADYSHPLPTAIARAAGMVATDVIGQSNIAAAGLLGLSGIRVEEVELRQSSKVNFYTTPVNPAATLLLAPYKYFNWG